MISSAVTFNRDVFTSCSDSEVLQHFTEIGSTCREDIRLDMTYAMKPEHLAYWAKSAVGDSRLRCNNKLPHVRYMTERGYDYGDCTEIS